MKKYSVFISTYGLPVVVNQDSLEYPDFIMSGSYEEAFTGSFAECLDHADSITESFIASI